MSDQAGDNHRSNSLLIFPEPSAAGMHPYQKLIAETEVKSRGCSHAFLSTYSFRARGFYEKFGYRVVGQLDDYPPGQSYYWMRKNF
jgi:hypothetical protein